MKNIRFVFIAIALICSLPNQAKADFWTYVVAQILAFPDNVFIDDIEGPIEESVPVEVVDHAPIVTRLQDAISKVHDGDLGVETDDFKELQSELVALTRLLTQPPHLKNNSALYGQQIWKSFESDEKREEFRRIYRKLCADVDLYNIGFQTNAEQAMVMFKERHGDDFDCDTLAITCSKEKLVKLMAANLLYLLQGQEQHLCLWPHASLELCFGENSDENTLEAMVEILFLKMNEQEFIGLEDAEILLKLLETKLSDDLYKRIWVYSLSYNHLRFDSSVLAEDWLDKLLLAAQRQVYSRMNVGLSAYVHDYIYELRVREGLEFDEKKEEAQLFGFLMMMR